MDHISCYYKQTNKCPCKIPFTHLHTCSLGGGLTFSWIYATGPQNIALIYRRRHPRSKFPATETCSREKRDCCMLRLACYVGVLSCSLCVGCASEIRWRFVAAAVAGRKRPWWFSLWPCWWRARSSGSRGSSSCSTQRRSPPSRLGHSSRAEVGGTVSMPGLWPVCHCGTTDLHGTVGG